MFMSYFVYILVFSNDHFYVGMSKTNRKGEYTNRLRAHRSAARSGKTNPLYVAWREIGEPIFMVVSEHTDRHAAAFAEIDLIASLDATNPKYGYNLAIGGQGLHAPKGSAIYQAMKAKVWGNPARNAKLSAALKGRPVSMETAQGFQDWLENGGREHRSATTKAQYEKPGAREAAAARTRQQMTEEARAHLSRKHKGRSDPRSAEGKERQREAVKIYLSTPEGKASARKGYDVFASKPEAVKNNQAALNLWRSSEENLRNCRRIAALSAKACRRPVKDLKTGIEYPSQRDMAKALGISDGAVSLRIKKGTAKRV